MSAIDLLRAINEGRRRRGKPPLESIPGQKPPARPPADYYSGKQKQPPPLPENTPIEYLI